jgi:outer membrane immunogenic protein
MKHFVLAVGFAAIVSSPVLAADLYMSPPPAMTSPVSAVDWTGFYIGGFASLGGGDYSLRVENLSEGDGPSVDEYVPSGNFKTKGSGFLAGAQIGADWQVDNFVFGGVADIAFSNYESSMSVLDIGDPSPYVSVKSRLDYLGTLRARAGVAFDNALIYAHGGLAFGQTTPSATLYDYEITGLKSSTRIGYTVGAGIEYRLDDNISLLTEYAFTDLGEATIHDANGWKATDHTTLHTVKVGLNYRF